MFISSIRLEVSMNSKNFCQRGFTKSRILEKKNVTFILVGENHADPAPVGMISHYIKDFHNLKVAQIRCIERPFDVSFEEHSKRIDDWVKWNQIFLQLDSIKNCAIHDPKLTFPYFQREQCSKLHEIFSHLFPQINEVSKQRGINNLLRYLNLEENALLNKQLTELKIPYQGIERYEKLQAELRNRIQINPEVILEEEEARIEAMTKNIFNRALPQIENTGGILWLSIGAIHSVNLASSLWNHIVDERLDQYSFKIITTACFSRYAYFPVEETLSGIAGSQKYFKNKRLIETSRKMPLNLIKITETAKHCYASPEFDDLIAQVKASHNIE